MEQIPIFKYAFFYKQDAPTEHTTQSLNMISINRMLLRSAKNPNPQISFL